MNKIDQKTVYTIKALCADMIQKANSGHPGLPLGAAGFTHVLWSQVLNHSALHPEWVNRDRFIYQQDMVLVCFIAYYIYMVMV